MLQSAGATRGGEDTARMPKRTFASSSSLRRREMRIRRRPGTLRTPCRGCDERQAVQGVSRCGWACHAVWQQEFRGHRQESGVCSAAVSNAVDHAMGW
jgi:hypothetical protein